MVERRLPGRLQSLSCSQDYFACLPRKSLCCQNLQLEEAWQVPQFIPCLCLWNEERRHFLGEGGSSVRWQ